jgi:hypothetical protein
MELSLLHPQEVSRCAWLALFMECCWESRMRYFTEIRLLQACGNRLSSKRRPTSY